MKRKDYDAILVYDGAKMIGISPSIKDAKKVAEQYNAMLGRTAIKWNRSKK